MAAMVLTAAASSGLGAQPPQLVERDVSFRNGAVELRGTLMLPDVEGLTPAVIFLHGSGPHPRGGFRPYAEEFARLGVASLSFDKRGSGESGGSWITSSIDDLAGDALVAMALLRTEEGIDPERIGFWGVSQAGWVAPLAASRSRDVAFMILISGGGASPRESELFSYRHAFEQAGLSDAERAEATEVLETYFGYLATGEGRAELGDHLERHRAGRLGPLVEQLEGILPEGDNRLNWSRVATHDPAAHIESFRGLILLLFRERDTDHPTELAVTRWREGLARAGNDRVTLMVFPDAGHGIRRLGDDTGTGRSPFADGYWEAQLGWLWRHVVAPRN
jgi:hypothetical protein